MEVLLDEGDWPRLSVLKQPLAVFRTFCHIKSAAAPGIFATRSQQCLHRRVLMRRPSAGNAVWLWQPQWKSLLLQSIHESRTGHAAS
jgi:hypothetical protein